MTSPLQCHGCDHFAWSTLESDRCGAFPEGIPDAIWLGGADHAHAYPGDGGVRRLPIVGPPANRVAMRRAAWSKRAVDRLAHESDPLGGIIVSVERSPLDARLDRASLDAAWAATEDAPAMLLVLLKARRIAELARAVRLTSAQLDLEGCDYLDDKGWLGVSLTLASYQTESSLADPRAAWTALSAPFRDGYLTTRVQQTLLRSMRRVVPEPPPAAEWARPGSDLDNIGALSDAVVAMRLAPVLALLRIEDVTLLEPWTAVTSPESLEAELARELMPGHRLFGRKLRAVAKRSDSDDVLFADDKLAAVVHLTWAKEPQPDLPDAQIFASVEEWVKRRMDPDHDDFTGKQPHAFAFELRSPLALEAMLAKLAADAGWEWSIGDSAWYGRYIWAKNGATRIRVIGSEEAERFTLQADLVDADDTGGDWFTTTRAVADAIMTAIEATGIVPTTPEHD